MDGLRFALSPFPNRDIMITSADFVVLALASIFTLEARIN
jgi:hypothetical protein